MNGQAGQNTRRTEMSGGYIMKKNIPLQPAEIQNIGRIWVILLTYSEVDVDKEAHTMSVTVTNHAAVAGDGPQTDAGETGPGQPGGGDALQTQDQIARTGVDEAAGAAAAVLAVALTGITAVALLRQRRSKTDR